MTAAVSLWCGVVVCFAQQGHEWNSDEVELLLDEGEESFNMQRLPEL
jgi:hypothetical protein